MFLLGHASWSYVLSKLTGREVKVNVPAWLGLLSGILPDYDIFFSRVIAHHTWTHSLFMLVPVAVLLSVWCGRMGFAFSLGILSHLLTDSLVGTIPIFYPFSTLQVGLSLGIPSIADTVLEVGMFLVVLVYAYQNKDYLQLTRPESKSLWFIIPLYSIVVLSVLFAGDNSINLAQFAFSRKALSLITLGHAAISGLLSLGVLQGVRGVWANWKSRRVDSY